MLGSDKSFPILQKWSLKKLINFRGGGGGKVIFSMLFMPRIFRSSPCFYDFAPEWLGAALPFAGSFTGKHGLTTATEKTPQHQRKKALHGQSTRKSDPKIKEAQKDRKLTKSGFWNKNSPKMYVTTISFDRDCITKGSFHTFQNDLSWQPMFQLALMFECSNSLGPKMLQCHGVGKNPSADAFEAIELNLPGDAYLKLLPARWLPSGDYTPQV